MKHSVTTLSLFGYLHRDDPGMKQRLNGYAPWEGPAMLLTFTGTRNELLNHLDGYATIAGYEDEQHRDWYEHVARKLREAIEDINE